MNWWILIIAAGLVISFIGLRVTNKIPQTVVNLVILILIVGCGFVGLLYLRSLYDREYK